MNYVGSSKWEDRNEGRLIAWLYAHGKFTCWKGRHFTLETATYEYLFLWSLKEKSTGYCFNTRHRSNCHISTECVCILKHFALQNWTQTSALFYSFFRRNLELTIYFFLTVTSFLCIDVRYNWIKQQSNESEYRDIKSTHTNICVGQTPHQNVKFETALLCQKRKKIIYYIFRNAVEKFHPFILNLEQWIQTL